MGFPSNGSIPVNSFVIKRLIRIRLYLAGLGTDATDWKLNTEHLLGPLGETGTFVAHEHNFALLGVHGVAFGGTTVDGLLSTADSESGELLGQLLLDVALVNNEVIGGLVLNGSLEFESVVDKAVLVLLLNALLDLGHDLALRPGFSPEGGEGVAGNQQGAGAQWAVLGAAHISILLSVEVTAKTAGTVPVDIVSEDNNAGSISSETDGWGDDLDSSVNHNVDLGNELVVVSTDDLGEGVDDLLVDLNLHVSSLGEVEHVGGTRQDDDLGLESEENSDGLGFGVDVLDEDGHWVLAGTVLGKNVLTSVGDVFAEGVGHVVEGADESALEGASWLRVESESPVTNVLEDALGGSERQEFLDQVVGLDVTEGKNGVGLVDVDGDELTVWGHFEVNFHLLLTNAVLWESVVGDIWVENGLDQVFKLVGDVLEGNWEIGPGDVEVDLVEGSSLVLADPETDGGDGESFLLILDASLGLD